MNLRFKITIVFFLMLNTFFGQNDAPVKKISFIVHSDNPTVTIAKYENALNNYGQLDQFRFNDTRRTIRFKNSLIWVELFSAQELLQTYGKEISPLTIKKNQAYKEIEFTLTMDGESIKPQIK